jgi:hypothetical protein
VEPAIHHFDGFQKLFRLFPLKDVIRDDPKTGVTGKTRSFSGWSCSVGIM